MPRKKKEKPEPINREWTKIEYHVHEELKFGDPKNPGTWLRLSSPIGQNGNILNKHIIQSWTGYDWKIMHRYDVLDKWNKWKRTCRNIQSKKEQPKKNGTLSALGTNSKKSSKKTMTSSKSRRLRKSSVIPA